MNVLELYRARLGEPKSKGSGSRGKELSGPCPGCGGKDRFVIWPDKGGHGEWMCRKCGGAGDGPQFLMDFEGLSFPQACQRLGMKLDPKAPSTPKLPSAVLKEDFTPRPVQAPSSETWLKKAQAFADDCHEQLLNTPEQLEWLASRGITRESVVKHRLGWNPKDVYRPRSAWGLDKKFKEDGTTPVKLWLPQGLTIPYSVNGQLLRIRIRKWVVRPGDRDDPRYYVVPSQPAGAGMDTWIRRTDAQVYLVVESELDGVLVDQEAGDLVGVVALGSAKTKPDAGAAKSLSSAGLILVATDFDEAGGQAFWSSPKGDPVAGGWWPRNFPKSIRWMVPEGKDPGDYVKDHGGNVRDWVMAGLPPSVTIGLSRSGGGSCGGGGVFCPVVAEWRRFVAEHGGRVRIVRFHREDGATEFDLDYTQDFSPEIAVHAALIVERMGGFSGALAAGLVKDVEHADLWRGW